MSRTIPTPILDYRRPHPGDRRAPSWLLNLLILAAIIAFPISYALFAVSLIIAPFLLLAGFTGALVGLAACALTAAATFGSLWTIDYCLARHAEHHI